MVAARQLMIKLSLSTYCCVTLSSTLGKINEFCPLQKDNCPWLLQFAEGESNGRRLITLRNRRGGPNRTHPAFERHLRGKRAQGGAAPPLSANRGARRRLSSIELSAASSLAAGGDSSTGDEPLAAATFRATSSGLTHGYGLVIDWILMNGVAP